MKVETVQVTKLVITDVKNLDPIAVYLEDFGPGRGKATITCCSDSWTACWGAMGNEYTIRRFLLACDTPYLVGKLSCGIERTVTDYERLVDAAQKEVVERRRSGRINKSKARELYADAENLAGCDCRERTGQFEDELYCYFGDEWYDCVPSKPNPKYEYLVRIINTVKEALKQEAVCC